MIRAGISDHCEIDGGNRTVKAGIWHMAYGRTNRPRSQEETYSDRNSGGRRVSAALRIHCPEWSGGYLLQLVAPAAATAGDIAGKCRESRAEPDVSPTARWAAEYHLDMDHRAAVF